MVSKVEPLNALFVKERERTLISGVPVLFAKAKGKIKSQVGI
jgi:hypothetical protein